MVPTGIHLQNMSRDELIEEPLSLEIFKYDIN